VSCKLVSMSAIAEAIKDSDPSVDTTRLIPHWDGDWQAEIEREDLDAMIEEKFREDREFLRREGDPTLKFNDRVIKFQKGE
jgi:hypothetical protein